MGLFSKKAPIPEPMPAPASEPTHEQKTKFHDEFDRIRVNLTDKMLRVELTGDMGSFKYGMVQADGDRIRIVSDGGILIAEVTRKGKAFKELEPFVGRGAEGIRIEAKTGDYGLYYQVHMKFRYTVVDQ